MLGVPALAAEPAGDTVKSAAARSQQAMALFMKGEFERAAEEYLAAYALSKEAKYLYNVGLCYYKLNRWDDAFDYFARFQLNLDPTVPKAYQMGAIKRVREIQRITSPVTIKVNVTGARVIIPGQPPLTTPLARPVRIRNGSHTLLFTAEGYTPEQRDVRVQTGTATTLVVEMKPMAGARTIQPPPASTEPPRRPDLPVSPPRDPQVGRPEPPARTETRPEPRPRGAEPRSSDPAPRPRRTGWLVMGISGAVLAVAGEGLAWGLWGAYGGGMDTERSTHGYLYYTGHALGALGAGLALTGFVVYVLKGRQRERSVAEPTHLQWQPIVSAGSRGAYLGVRGWFR